MAVSNIVILVHVSCLWEGGGYFGCLCIERGWAPSRCSVNAGGGGIKLRMMTNSKCRTQDVNLFVGHTASVRILLIAKEMSPTVGDAAAHCSNICASETRNLLLYVWGSCNQHRQRNALSSSLDSNNVFMCILHIRRNDIWNSNKPTQHINYFRLISNLGT